MGISKEEQELIGKEVEASMNGEDWHRGRLVEIIDLFIPYKVHVHGLNEVRGFATIRPVEEKPVGMYGETPRVQVGGLTICRQGPNSVWIEEVGGEGAEFSDELFYPFLRKFYDEHF